MNSMFLKRSNGDFCRNRGPGRRLNGYAVTPQSVRNLHNGAANKFVTSSRTVQSLGFNPRPIETFRAPEVIDGTGYIHLKVLDGASRMVSHEHPFKSAAFISDDKIENLSWSSN